MKSCTIDNLAETFFDVRCMPAGILPDDDRFATVPMIAASPARAWKNEHKFATMPLFAVNPARTRKSEQEEVLHTSFEEAISERAARISQHLRRLPTAAFPREWRDTDPLVMEAPSGLLRLTHFWRERQRAIILVCLGLSLLMTGFDLMGLLLILNR